MNAKQNDADKGTSGYISNKILPKLHVPGGWKGRRERRQSDGDKVATGLSILMFKKCGIKSTVSPAMKPGQAV